MRARLLKKLLNNTGYTVADHGEYIGVGSPLCHDLISLNKKTLKLKYALDTWNKGRAALEEKSELLAIWDKLSDLVKTGEINQVLEGVDELEVKLPVFYTDNGRLVETFTDEYGWPNTTQEGVLMYDNTFFKTKKAAIQRGIEEMEAWANMLQEQIADKEAQIAEFKVKKAEKEARKAELESLLKSIK